jgi:hypothetical protein
MASMTPRPALLERAPLTNPLMEQARFSLLNLRVIPRASRTAKRTTRLTSIQVPVIKDYPLEPMKT